MFVVKKKNKKLYIVDDNDTIVYGIPDFIKIHSRDILKNLADKFNEKGKRDIDAIIEWESSVRPIKIKSL